MESDREKAFHFYNLKSLPSPLREGFLLPEGNMK